LQLFNHFTKERKKGHVLKIFDFATGRRRKGKGLGGHVMGRSSRGESGVVVRSILDWMGWWVCGLLGVEVIDGVGDSEAASVVELPEC
jgi:hypothetical protein